MPGSVGPATGDAPHDHPATMTDTLASPQPTHPKWLLPVIGAAIIALVVANNVGNAVWAAWVVERPLSLLALNSTNKYLLATSVVTDLWPYLLIACLRLMAPDPLFYAIGYLYGDRALHWAGNVFPGIKPVIAQAEADEGSFKILMSALLVIMPNNPVCLIAGAVRVPIARFITLSVVGTIGRVLLMRWIGYLFEDQIQNLLDVVVQYQKWFLLASIAGVAIYVGIQATRRQGLIGAVEELEDELGD